MVSDEISLSPWLSNSRTIFDTACSIRSCSTGRLRSAICTERSSLSRSNGTRRPLRLITVSSRSCTRSNVVKRKLQVRQTRRRRMTDESSVGRESFTWVSRLAQFGQRMTVPNRLLLSWPGHSASKDARGRAYVPAIHVVVLRNKTVVDARDMRGHDEGDVVPSVHAL